MRPETIAVHGGYTPDPTTKSVAVPIYQTSSHAFDSAQHGAQPFDPKVQGQNTNPKNTPLGGTTP